MVDWYIPAVTGKVNDAGLIDDYLSVWAEIENSLPMVPQSFLHIDYHFENLMWLPDRDGLFRCGVLDFQGAMVGPAPYDLANLLEDARVDVPEDLRLTMLDRFCADMSAEEKENFMNWYRVLVTQFHCRVIGQFIKMAKQDGKTRYLDYLPRVAGYLHQGLKHPVLQPLQQWFDEQGIDFAAVPDIDLDVTDALVSKDIF